MEAFFSEHWPLATAFIAILLGIVSGLTSREFGRVAEKFSEVERRNGRQDGRLDVMAKELKEVTRENADSKRDRESLHTQMDQNHKSILRHLEMMERNNQVGHDDIKRLIRNGGNHA